MYTENRNLRGVQKFVEAVVVRRNSIGSNLVSANSCTSFVLCKMHIIRCENSGSMYIFLILYILYIFMKRRL